MAFGLVNSALREVVDLFLPPSCVGCQSPLIRGETSVCVGCRTRLNEIRGCDYCRKCGAEIPPFGASPEGCGRCREEKRSSIGLVRVAAYETLLGDWIRGLKYGQRDALQFVLAAELAGVIRSAAWFSDVEVLTFVPTCWQHQLIRRVHVTTLLAPLVAKHLDIPLLPLLRRVRGGPHQVGLPQAQRIANIRGAFKSAKRTTLGQTRVCLMDDVTTTGATLNECARQLVRAGAGRVYAAVLAKAGASTHTS